MVAVVVVVNMVPVATTVTMLLGVILVVGTDATATGGITTASKAMEDILEIRVVVALMDTNRVGVEEAVGGVWLGRKASTPLLLEWEEVSGGGIINSQKAIGHVRILRKYPTYSFSLHFSLINYAINSQVHKYELCPPHGMQ